MNINNDVSTYKPPYFVAIIDTQDANYYADIFDDERYQIFDKVEDLHTAKALADALFVVKNYKWKSLEEMNNADGGFDVRVYDQSPQCVYAAHQKIAIKWIWSLRE